MVLLTFYIRWPWIDGGKFNFDDGEMRLKKKRKNMGNRTTRERERERERTVTRGNLLFRWPRQTPNWQQRVGGCYARSHEEDAQLLLCSPFVSYWEGQHGGCVCSPLRFGLFSLSLSLSLHEWKDVGTVTVKVWLLTTRGGSRTAVESSGTARCARERPPELSRASSRSLFHLIPR